MIINLLATTLRQTNKCKPKLATKFVLPLVKCSPLLLNERSKGEATALRNTILQLSYPLVPFLTSQKSYGLVDKQQFSIIELTLNKQSQ